MLVFFAILATFGKKSTRVLGGAWMRSTFIFLFGKNLQKLTANNIPYCKRNKSFLIEVDENAKDVLKNQ